VSFSVSTAEKIPAAIMSFAGATGVSVTPANAAIGSLVIASGTDTLAVDSVRMVLAQVVLRQVADTSCGKDGHNDAADATCANLSTGPFIVKLPLTAGALSLFDIPIPKGTYTGIRVRVHNPRFGDVGPNVATFLAAHPEWVGKSIMVDGTFNGVAFHWSHDPPAQLEHVFNPPIVVNDATVFNFTLQIDVGTWFVAATGKLIPPNAPTNALYPQIAANVAKSFHVFKDDKKNGHNDGP
jgi:hypothetical protein